MRIPTCLTVPLYRYCWPRTPRARCRRRIQIPRFGYRDRRDNTFFRAGSRDLLAEACRAMWCDGIRRPVRHRLCRRRSPYGDENVDGDEVSPATDEPANDAFAFAMGTPSSSDCKEDFKMNGTENVFEGTIQSNEQFSSSGQRNAADLLITGTQWSSPSNIDDDYFRNREKGYRSTWP